MTIGEKIKKIRKDMKISQSDMSKTLGINRNQLSRIENNHSEISAKNIETLCTKYNISINELLDLNTENTNKDKIDYIYNSCNNLSDEELDFIIKAVDIINYKYCNK